MLWCSAMALAAASLGGCPERDPDLGLPAEYRQMDVPQDQLDSADARRRGRALFLTMCSICHGENADGRGQRTLLTTSARDFTRQDWRRTMTPRRVYWTVQEGVLSSSMPAFPFLTPDQTWDLVSYVLSVSEQGAQLDEETPDPGAPDGGG